MSLTISDLHMRKMVQGCLTTGRKHCETKTLLSRSSYLILKMHVSAIPANKMKSWRPYPRRTYTRSISSPFVLQNNLVPETCCR